MKLDGYNFFGSSLHVCYAPEYESVDDLRDKMNERKYIVNVKCNKYGEIQFHVDIFSFFFLTIRRRVFF